MAYYLIVTMSIFLTKNFRQAEYIHAADRLFNIIFLNYIGWVPPVTKQHSPARQQQRKLLPSKGD